MLKPQLVLDQQCSSSLCNNKNLFPHHITPFASNPLRDQINRKYYNSINKSHYNGEHKFCVRARNSNKLNAVATTSSSVTAAVAPKWNKDFTLRVELDVETSKVDIAGKIYVEVVAAEKGPGKSYIFEYYMLNLSNG